VKIVAVFAGKMNVASIITFIIIIFCDSAETASSTSDAGDSAQRQNQPHV